MDNIEFVKGFKKRADAPRDYSIGSDQVLETLRLMCDAEGIGMSMFLYVDGGNKVQLNFVTTAAVKATPDELTPIVLRIQTAFMDLLEAAGVAKRVGADGPAF